MTIEVRRLTAADREDFGAVHCERNGTGWCHCVAWWTPSWEGWGERTEEENRALREELFERGEYDGYLLYVDGRAAAWCQVGPRDRLVKLVRQFTLEPDANTWAITCFVVAPEHRRTGLARMLLRAVLDDLRARGVARVEAFPRHGEGLDPEDLWTGPEAMYRDEGFEVVRAHYRSPIMALAIDNRRLTIDD